MPHDEPAVAVTIQPLYCTNLTSASRGDGRRRGESGSAAADLCGGTVHLGEFDLDMRNLETCGDFRFGGVTVCLPHVGKTQLRANLSRGYVMMSWAGIPF